MKNTNTPAQIGSSDVHPIFSLLTTAQLRFFKRILLLAFIVLSSFQSYSADGDPFYGHTKRLYNITPWGHTRWGLEYLPDDFYTTTQKYPVLVYFHGVGETGSTEGSLANLLYNGPSNFIAFSNYNMQFVNPNTGQLQKFIYIALQAQYWSPDVNEMWYILKNNPRLKDRISNIFYTGLSAGGQQTMMSVLTNQEMASGITAIVPMSSAGFDRTAVQFARNGNVKAWCFHGLQDNVCAWQITSDFNDSLGANSRWTQAPSIHGNWNTIYTKDYREMINGHAMNIYEWMLSTIPVTSNMNPVAIAGPDQNLSVLATTLNGDGRDTDGIIVNYSWVKLNGPAQYSIVNSTSPVTQLNNLTAGTYMFELSVTDNMGAIGKDTVIIIENSVALPVKLTQFIVKENNGNNLLQWKTSAEVNSDYFTIERSINGRVFESIGHVVASGFSSVEKNYGFTDKAPLSGINYYRLVSVDKDNRSEISKIICTSARSTRSIEIINVSLSYAKNTVSMVINSNESRTVNLVVIDTGGRILLNTKVVLQKGVNSLERAVATLVKGLYYIKIFTRNESVLNPVVSTN